MADIIFITPNTTGAAVDETAGTLLLATILRQKGLQPKVLPFAHFGSTEDFSAFLHRATEEILKHSPRIVSFYTRCDCYHIILKLAEALKRQAELWIVLGGPQADICAVETVSRIPCVDFVCRGEGETTVYPFSLPCFGASRTFPRRDWSTAKTDRYTPIPIRR